MEKGNTAQKIQKIQNHLSYWFLLIKCNKQFSILLTSSQLEALESNDFNSLSKKNTYIFN